MKKASKSSKSNSKHITPKVVAKHTPKIAPKPITKHSPTKVVSKHTPKSLAKPSKSHPPTISVEHTQELEASDAAKPNKRGYSPEDDRQLIDHWKLGLQDFLPFATEGKGEGFVEANYFSTLAFAKKLAKTLPDPLSGAPPRSALQILGKLKDFRRRFRMGNNGFAHFEVVEEVLRMEGLILKAVIGEDGDVIVEDILGGVNGNGLKRKREGKEEGSGGSKRKRKGKSVEVERLEEMVRRGELEVKLSEIEVTREDQKGYGVEDNEWKMQMALMEQLRSSAITLDGLGLRGEATWCMKRVIGVLKNMLGVIEHLKKEKSDV